MSKKKTTVTATAKKIATKKTAKMSVKTKREAVMEENVLIDNGKINKKELAKQVAENSAVLEIHISQPWFKQRIKSDTFLNASGNDGNVDPSVIHVVQDVVNQKRLKDIMRQRIKFTNDLKLLSVPGGILSLGNGQYLIPLKNIDRAVELIDKFVADRNVLIDSFGEKYEEIKEEAKQQRGVFYNAADYPEFDKIRAMYRLSYRFLSNSVPEEIAKVNSSIYAKEKARIEAECEKAVDEIRTALRESFSELVDHLTERLKVDDETGKGKVFHAARVTKLTEFIEAFNNRNLTGDMELAALTKKASDILSGVSIDDIRKENDVRATLSSAFDKLKAEADTLVVTKSRAVKLD